MPEDVHVEDVPQTHAEGAVWVDGSWAWAGRRWVWRPGAWEVAPQGAYYARPVFVRIPLEVREPDGGAAIGYGMKLMYIPGHWHLPDGGTWDGAESSDAGAP